jgi:carboxylesterase
MIVNPELEGASFCWQAGSTGILLVHGFTATTAEVRPLARQLHESGFTVAAPLLPGHNSHPADLNQVKWKDWVSIVEKTFFDLQQICTRVIVGGESTGGLLALDLATRNPKISAILLYAPALKLNMSTYDSLRLRLLAPFVPWIAKPNLDGNPSWQGYSVYPLKGALQLLALQNHVNPKLGKINQPVLIIQGRRDPQVDPEVPNLIVKRINSKICQSFWLEDSAHCVLLEGEFEKLVQITLDFINSIMAENSQ